MNCFTLYIDNKAALALAKNPTHHDRTKHMDIRYRFIRSEVTSGSVNIQAIGTGENVADILTKALPKAAFEGHRLGMVVFIV